MAMDETSRARTELLVGIDADDPTLVDYYNIPELDLPVKLHIASDLRWVVPWVNHLACTYADGYAAVGHVGDDNIPRTVGWDVRILEALDRQPLAFGNDLHPGRPPGSLCCHVFMRKAIPRALGYFGPPSLRHMYVDDVWMAWGREIGIEFCEDVIMEHMHPSAGKAEVDDGYRRTDPMMTRDRPMYHAYMAEDFHSDIRTIQAAL